MVAAAFLVIALTLPWDFFHDAADHVGVVLVTVASLASLALVYLPRLGVAPPSWTPATGRAARLLLNVPYAMAVVAALAQDAFTEQGNGLGLAVAFGLAGALVAAAPRDAELAERASEEEVSEHWRRGLVVLGLVPAGFAALTVIVAAVEGFLDFLGLGAVITLLVVLAIGPVLVALPSLGAGVRRDPAWRAVLIGLGLVFSIMLLWMGTGDDSSLSGGGQAVESFHQAGMGIMFWLTPAAVAAAATTGRTMRRVAAHQLWIRSAARLFTLAATANALLLAIVLLLFAQVELLRGELTAAIIVGGVTLVGALIARSALGREADPRGRGIALAVCVVYVVLGIVALAVNPEFLGERGVDLFALAVTFGFPALIVTTLTLPPAVREHYASLASGAHR